MGVSSALKPGLGLLLDGLSPTVAATAAAAVAAAVAVPGGSYVPVKADAVTAGPAPQFRLGGRGAFPEASSHIEPRPFVSLLDPYSVGLVFAKNIAIHVLLKVNHYMLQLNDYELQRFQAEEQGALPPLPPDFPGMSDALHSGSFFAIRELSVRAVRLAYEHLFYRRLGPKRSEPFLRTSVTYLVDVLAFRYRTASWKQKAFSFTFAALHSNALFYAAEATVAVLHFSYDVIQHKREKPRRATQLVLKATAFHTGRCVLLLVTTSMAAALGTMVKPGLGTKVLPLVVDFAINSSVQPVRVWMLR